LNLCFRVPFPPFSQFPFFSTPFVKRYARDGTGSISSFLDLDGIPFSFLFDPLFFPSFSTGEVGCACVFFAGRTVFLGPNLVFVPLRFSFSPPISSFLRFSLFFLLLAAPDKENQRWDPDFFFPPPVFFFPFPGSSNSRRDSCSGKFFFASSFPYSTEGTFLHFFNPVLARGDQPCWERAFCPRTLSVEVKSQYFRLIPPFSLPSHPPNSLSLVAFFQDFLFSPFVA